MEVIAAKDNSKLKLIRSLRLKKHRREQGLFPAEGLRLAEEAARWGDCAFALFSEDALAGPRAARLAQSFRDAGVACFCTAPALFNSAAATENPQGVLAVCRIPALTEPAPAPWFAYGDGLSDPGNLGAVMRSAAAAGCGGLLLSPTAADPWNPKTVRASMGAVFRLPLWQAESDEAAYELLTRLQAVPLVTAMDGRDIRLCRDLLARPHCWILGAEAEGVSLFWRQRAAAAVSLPMAAGTESLNVSCAAAVLFYQSFFAADTCPVNSDVI
ncbi:MAG: RNA methyltransferase [Firmicutes bacterium]|nr:RNA methyltransferase [Bacillota bacterium]